MTYREWMTLGTERLQAAGIEEASLDAWYLLERASGISRSRYYLVQKDPFPEEAAEKFQKLLAERERRVPLQQILGDTEFMGLTFLVNEHVLTPRQDTELLVELALKNLQCRTSPARVLDMCTGSGCILISLMALGSYGRGVGADISEDALRVARMNGIFNRENWEKNGRGANDILWLQSNLFEKVSGRFDVIVSNPPYIPAAVIETLMPEVRVYEPRLALEGADEGLEFYKKIAGAAEAYLKPEGWLFFEIGCEQAEAVSGILMENGFRDIHTVKDLAGLDRVVYGKR